MMLRLLEEWRENLDKTYVVGGVLMDLYNVFDCVPHYFFTCKICGISCRFSFSLLYVFKNIKTALIYSTS